MIASGHTVIHSLTKVITILTQWGDGGGLGGTLLGDRSRTERQGWRPGLSSRKMEGTFG